MTGASNFMATQTEWVTGYARQADADYRTFELHQKLSIPECHKLQFLQMAYEKLVKAHPCREGEPTALQASHAYVSKNLPMVLLQHSVLVNFTGAKARDALTHARQLAQEIEVLAPAVKRGGQRPDNCEYPWEDNSGAIHSPLDWSFHPSQLILFPTGRTILKMIRGSIDRLLR